MRSIIVTANLPVECANSTPTSVLPWQNSDPSQPLQALAHFGATWGVWNNVLSLLLGCGEASAQGRNVKATTQMLLLQRGRQSLLSLLSLKLQNNLSDLCMEQHYVSFHCVQTLLLLKMLQFMESWKLQHFVFLQCNSCWKRPSHQFASTED